MKTGFFSIRKQTEFLFLLFLFSRENRWEAYLPLSSNTRTKANGMRLKDKEIEFISFFTE